MSVTLAFLLAVLFSGIGVLPPGMLNMRIATISIKKSLKKAKEFIYGALVIIAVQSFIGYKFATFLEVHPQVEDNLKLTGSIIFSLLTIFFIGKGIQNVIQEDKIETVPTESKFSPFYQGLVLSLLNVFPIPYYAFLSLYCSAFIPDFFEKGAGSAFVLGSVVGTGFIYMLYAYLFKRLENKVTFFVKNVNFIIAFITGSIVVFTIYNWK